MFANRRALFVFRIFLSGQVVKHVEIIVFIGFFLHCNAGDCSSGTLWKVKTIKLFLFGEVKYFFSNFRLLQGRICDSYESKQAKFSSVELSNSP